MSNDMCCEKNGLGCDCGWDIIGCLCCMGELDGSDPHYCTSCIEEAREWKLFNTGVDHTPSDFFTACQETPYLFGIDKYRALVNWDVPF